MSDDIPESAMVAAKRLNDLWGTDVPTDEIARAMHEYAKSERQRIFDATVARVAKVAAKSCPNGFRSWLDALTLSDVDGE